MDEEDYALATARGQARANEPRAVGARYLSVPDTLVVTLSTGMELHVPVARIEGLAQAAAEDLHEIEVSPAGTGLHFPRLDADVYVPGLLAGITGSARWMARLPAAQAPAA
ncbi:DUF2442 domain-containing protein [Methylobacterium sp. SyP6R]|uniref:DUF2442 domain-containing protein n=1 Tax=Methylobacterium sp. SyP6R TaxID=2718876 RepID=UPI001F342B7F|nr:DUF2442 domain-containing protein [Methylobacterium sp. SyP6R]MCF4129386.1 DUF2442 domain-containing protein [Methylobacterium sp. SyP6R]